MIERALALSLSALLIAGAAIAQNAGHAGHGATGHSPYAGQEQRAVSTLSDDDLVALKAGAGWGLAKPAELNGFPGPLHVLQLAGDLTLTPDQRAKVQALYDHMKTRAITAGRAYMETERALDIAFRSGSIDKAVLAERLAAAEAAKARLRAVHLEAHLDTVPILSHHQRRKYAELRGYGSHPGHKQH